MIIIAKCKKSEEREFYINSACNYGWTTRVLEHQIKNKTHDKYILNQTNYNKVSQEKCKNQKHLAIKDHYTFDFLELSDKHSEKELENSLIRNVREFLLELGGNFTFVGNQFRLLVGDEEFYIDLLLYHRRLQCLVAVDLKTGKFKPEYKGKMEFYLNVLNDLHKLPNENEAIGIIICKNISRLVVEYSLKKASTSIGIASYGTGPELPVYYEEILPSVERIEKGVTRLMGNNE